MLLEKDKVVDAVRQMGRKPVNVLLFVGAAHFVKPRETYDYASRLNDRLDLLAQILPQVWVWKFQSLGRNLI